MASKITAFATALALDSAGMPNRKLLSSLSVATGSVRSWLSDE
nr:hypothetical protein [Janthinobacterium sp.]